MILTDVVAEELAIRNIVLIQKDPEVSHLHRVQLVVFSPQTVISPA